MYVCYLHDQDNSLTGIFVIFIPGYIFTAAGFDLSSAVLDDTVQQGVPVENKL